MDLRQTGRLHLLGVTRIPTILWMGATVLRLDEAGCEIRIPLRWRTRNHVGSMYVGALVTGADVASGLLAADLIYGRYPRVRFIFADLHAEFLRRADGPVRFRCEQGRQIRAAVEEADRTGERQIVPVEVSAQVEGAAEPAALFRMGLSLKRK